MKPFILNDHLKRRLIERPEISIEWITRVLKNPTMSKPDPIPGRVQVWGQIPEFGDRWLKVVYDQTTEPCVVITAHFDRGKKKRMP